MVLNKVLDYFDGVWCNNERKSDAATRKNDFRATFEEPSTAPIGKRILSPYNLVTLALGTGLVMFSLSSAGEKTLDYLTSHYLKQESTYTANSSLSERIANR